MEYGQLGKKYVLRTFEGEINWEGEKEDLPKEEMFEKEQELLKKVYDRKNVLVGGRQLESWKGLMDYSGRKQSFSQPSFLSTD